MAGGRGLTYQTITSSTSWVCPAGVSFVWLIGQGGGQGGQNGGTSISVSASGGASTSPTLQIVPVTPGSTYSVTIGAGGAVNLGNGGDTIFGSLATFYGASGDPTLGSTPSLPNPSTAYSYTHNGASNAAYTRGGSSGSFLGGGSGNQGFPSTSSAGGNGNSSSAGSSGANATTTGGGGAGGGAGAIAGGTGGTGFRGELTIVWVEGPFLRLRAREFLSNDSFLVPAGQTNLLVFGCGGGSGGNGGGSPNSKGLAGGMASYFYPTIIPVTPNTTYSVTIGSGGIGGASTASVTPGSAGSDSSFGSVVFAGAPVNSGNDGSFNLSVGVRTIGGSVISLDAPYPTGTDRPTTSNPTEAEIYTGHIGVPNSLGTNGSRGKAGGNGMTGLLAGATGGTGTSSGSQPGGTGSDGSNNSGSGGGGGGGGNLSPPTLCGAGGSGGSGKIIVIWAE